MEKISSADYRENEDGLRQSIELNRQLGNEQTALIYETMLKRIETHRRIEESTGLKFDVIVGGLESNVAAFVDSESSLNGVSESTLDNPEFALHAARHEGEHRLNSIFKLPLKQISPEDQQAICAEIDAKELDETELIEGFNELSTFRKHGANDNSGYAGHEVPLAEKIENLANQKLNISLLSIFRSGDAQKFVITLQQLAIKLRLGKKLGELMSQAA